MKRSLVGAAIALAATWVATWGAASAARAELQNEILLVQLPAGYKVDFQKRQDKAQISEMVPTGESVTNWTEMVTVQIFFGLNATPEQFKARVEQGWTGACLGGTSKLIAATQVRGYPSNLWAMSCPRNPGTGKPENTWVKAIKGNDSLYVVQKAFKFAPSKEQEKKWLDYLDGVSVCDTRVPARACPKGM